MKAAALAVGILLIAAWAEAGQLTATWVDNSLGAASTAIERRLSADTVYSLQGTVTPGVTTWVDTTPVTGVIYCYRAYAFTSDAIADRSPNSSEACASFVPTTPAPGLGLTVTLTGTGSGTVTSAPAGIACGSACSSVFPANVSVTLTAAPAAGSTFAGWGTACNGSTAPTCAVLGSGNLSLSAAFALIPPPPAPFVVTVAKTGTGTGRVTTEPAGIDCGPVCTGSFTSKVTLTATPDATSTFAGWGGVCAGTTGACTFSVSAGASVGVSADFAVIPPPPPPPADTTSPTVAFTMTSNVVRKAKIPVAITGSDDRAVVRVELYVSGGLVGVVNASAGTITWTVPNAAQKSYTLQAKAYDAAGNVGLSQRVTVYPR